MPYTKHNYQKGDELLASQLNDMDDQIALNEQTADILVTVSNTQPPEEKNRVWVKATPSEIEIPTMEDVDELNRQMNDLSTVENRLIPIDGIITQFPSNAITFNKGYYVSSGAVTSTSYPKRACLTKPINLKARDFLCKSSSTLSYFLCCSIDGGTTFTGRSVNDNEFVIAVDCIAYLTLIFPENISEGVYNSLYHDAFWIKRPGSLIEVQPTVNALIDVEIDLFDGYYSSTGSIVADTSEDACKYTQKIKCFDGMKLHIALNYLTASHLMWLATCEWKKDGTFVRSNVVAAYKISYEFDYEPTSDIDEVSITFRSFNDYEFKVQSTTSIFAFYDYLSGTTNGKQPPVNYAFSKHLTKGINHRGYNRVAPENTMPAFKLSVENGFSFVETDIRFTSDNIPVLLHDATVDRTSNGTGNIADMTFAQARTLDFGSWKSETYAGTKIPSFEEFILFCRNVQIFPYIEISASYTATQFDKLVEIVKNHGMLNAVTWISFNANNLKNIALRDATARLCLIYGGALTEDRISEADELKTGINEVFVSNDYNYITNDTVTLCKAHGFQLETWTINTAELIAALPSYVSGGTSDSVNFETIVKEQALS